MFLPHWLLRLYEALGALALAALMCGLLLFLSGCAAIKEREKRFMPEAVNPPEVEALFVADYSAAIANARANPTQENVRRLVDAGSALSAVRCGAWIDRDILAAHGILMTDGTAAAVGAGTTMAAAAFKLHPGAVGAVGLAQMIAHLFGQVEKTGLGAPDSFQAQQKMLTTLGKCSDSLIARAGGMTFAQAIIGIDLCRRTCSPGAAATISTQALMQTEVVVQPDGALTTTAVTSSAVRDDAGARLRNFWRPNGVADRAAEARIRAWMRDNGIESSITMLANSELYAAARAKAVLDLGIGP